MRNPYFRMTMLFLGFFVLVGLACLSSGGADPTATSEITVMQEDPAPEPTPTKTETVFDFPDPTDTPEVDEPVGDTSDAPPAYFTEEFEGDLSGWTYFLMSGSDDGMELYTDKGRLVFDLHDSYQWVYVTYDEYYYPEVYIEMMAENRGMNTNDVSLICNYSDEGWYEFNISNDGTYRILAFSELINDYQLIYNGGSTRINTGKDVNYYAATCKGNKLALYINGYLEREVTDSKHNFREGQVGFGVSSWDILPIRVEVDYFLIDLP